MFYRLYRSLMPSYRTAKKLYPHIVTQTRQPVFFEKLGVEDDLQGRFNVLSLHLYLVLERLNAGRAEHKMAEKVEQDLIDIFFDDMDAVFRATGTGDMGVGHKVKKLANQFYGRFRAYQDSESEEDFAAALIRNVYKEDGFEDEAGHLGTYALKNRKSLAGQSIEALLKKPAFVDVGEVS